MANAAGNPGTNPRLSTDMISSVGWNSRNALMTDEERRAAEQHRAARERQKQVLNLQRESILSQRVSNPGRRAALEAALTQVEAQIQALG